MHVDFNFQLVRIIYTERERERESM